MTEEEEGLPEGTMNAFKQTIHINVHFMPLTLLKGEYADGTLPSRPQTKFSATRSSARSCWTLNWRPMLMCGPSHVRRLLCKLAISALLLRELPRRL